MDRSMEEISRVTDWALEGVDCGTRHPGMSYEQGVLDALNWMTGMDEHAPDQD